jgi:hypothetical protein
MKLSLKNNDYIFNKDLTEYENAHNNNFFRIWDAGKVKWKIKV